MSQKMASVVCAKNGSITADAGSGIRVMSDSLIAFQPAMDEPSNIKPWVNASSSISDRSKVTCCHLPLGSVKRRSTNLTSLSLIIFRTDFASAAMGSSLSLVKRLENGPRFSPSHSVGPFFTSSDTDGFFDVEHKNFPVTDTAGAGGFQNGI